MKKDYLLAKWLNNDITKDELELLEASPEYVSYMKIAKATSEFQTPLFNEDENFKVISSKVATLKNDSKVVKLNPLATFLKIAAVLAILFSGYVFINSLDTSLETQIAEKQSLKLPDDSQVILNANSKIDYNKIQWNKNRELTLSGEAYFKVTEGKKFRINTSEGIVSVLGTQFNVFVRDNLFYIKCYEGLVSVAFNDTLIKLPASKKLKIENGIIVEHYTIKDTSPSWIDNESSFDNATLSSVIKELERQYPIKITTKNIDLNQRFSGSFSHKNINLALTLICDPLNLSFIIKSEENVILYAKDNQ